MKRFIVAIAVVLSAVLPFGVVADTGRAGEYERKQTTDTDLAGRYLRAILPNVGEGAKAEPVKVRFSRDWVDAQPEAKGDEQWRCLSEALYFEARGESVKGQFAVAEVIMNRVKSSRFPGTLCGVIKQGTGRKYQCQFTYTCDGYKDVIAEHQAYSRVSKVARAMLDGAEGSGNLTEGATHYHTTAVRPAWSRTYKKTAQIGVHLFYRHNYRTAQSN
jgi:spore germination cell wall hydrolase CwlJ-like protein